MTWPNKEEKKEQERASGAEVSTPQVQGVSVDHPSIASFLRQCAKDGRAKDEAIKLSGMPYEVVDRYYQEEKRKT